MTNPDPGHGTDALVDERVATWAAAALIRRSRPEPAEVDALRAAVRDDLPAVDAAARAWTGLGGDLPPVEVRVVGRGAWVRANLTAMRGVLEPIRERIEQRPGAAQVLGAQFGALFGVLSSKVLGQYVLPLGGPGTGELVIVGPNLLELEERHGELAVPLRRAVILHEVTHQLQFAATPWLGDHLRGLVDRHFSHTREDGHVVGELVGRIGEIAEQVRSTGTIRPVIEIVLTDEQRAVISEAQALMSLLEGHASAAMFDAAPDELIADPDEVRAVFESRRRDVTSRILAVIGGMELKRRQYRDGELFVRHVMDATGADGLNRAFADPRNLPGLEEIADPGSWLDRVRVA